jgi:hypothetical protein
MRLCYLQNWALLFTVPDRFFIVHKCLIELSLLLKNGGQIRMGGRKLRKYFQRLQVESGGLLNVALFSFDVRQVVQRVGVGWRKPVQKEKLSLFELST